MRAAACTCGYPALTATDVTVVARDLKLSPPWPTDPETSVERLNHAISQYLDRDHLSLPAKERLAADAEALATRWLRALLLANERTQARSLRDLRSLLHEDGAADLFGSAAIDSVLRDPPCEKAINSLRSIASEVRHSFDREQRRVAGDDGWPAYVGTKPRHRPQERAWRFLAETLLDEVWEHHSGELEPGFKVDPSRQPALRTSPAANFGARLLEICADHFLELAKELENQSPTAPIVHQLRDQAEALRGHTPRLVAFIEERKRQRRS